MNHQSNVFSVLMISSLIIFTSKEALAQGGKSQMIILPDKPAILDKFSVKIKQPDDIDPVCTKLGVQPHSYNYNLATNIDLTNVGLGKSIYIPVQISKKEGGRNSIYYLKKGEEILTGMFVTNNGLAWQYIKRLSGCSKPAMKGDNYSHRITTREGTTVFAGQGQIEVMDPKTGMGRIRISTNLNGNSLEARGYYIESWFWSFYQRIYVDEDNKKK